MIVILRAAALALLLVMAGVSTASADQILVFAAASLKNALDAAAGEFEKGGDKVAISYAASSILAKQIENGAPADIFISADLDWMNYIEAKHQLKAGSRSNFLGNKLVLIAPAAGAAPVEIEANFPLARLLGDGRLAMADPDAVPAGKYGKAALEKLGVWASVEAKVARAEDVRAALRFVARKEAPFGIVYQTDAAAETNVRIVGTFPDGSYPTIIYPIAETVSARGAAAKFLAFLKSAPARPFFEKQGFTVLP